MWSLDSLSSGVAAPFSQSQSCAHNFLIHATPFCYQVNATSFQRELMLVKLASHTQEHLLRSSGCIFPDHSWEKKTTCRPMRKCIKSCKGSTFFSNIISSGKHYLLCSSRPLIPFWTHKKEIINQEKEVLVEYYEWFTSYFVNKIENIRAAEQPSTANHFFH